MLTRALTFRLISIAICCAVSSMLFRCVHKEAETQVPQDSPSYKSNIRFCEEGISDTQCLSKLRSAFRKHSLSFLLPRFTEECLSPAGKSPEGFLRQQIYCFEVAKIFDSMGNRSKAIETRKKACDLDIKSCVSRYVQSYAPNFLEALDLSIELCAQTGIPRGYFSKNYLSPICMALKERQPGQSVDEAWVSFLARRFPQSETKISEFRSLGIRESPKVVLEKEQNTENWSTISKLRDFKFPVRVRFYLSYLEPPMLPLDFKPSNDQMFLSSFYSYQNLDSHKPPSWAQVFSGYASLSLSDWMSATRRLQIHNSQNALLVTGIIVGYRETGVVPVPIVILDRVSSESRN